MSYFKINTAIKKWISSLRSLMMTAMAADWSYEKAFYYITIGLVLISLLLKIINLINVSLSGGDLFWTAILLCLTILAIAFFLAHGTRLLIKAIKKDMK